MRTARSQSARQIGAALGLSPKNINLQRTRIVQIVGMRGIAALMRYARQRTASVDPWHLPSYSAYPQGATRREPVRTRIEARA